jgi:hypothetical protein
MAGKGQQDWAGNHTGAKLKKDAIVLIVKYLCGFIFLTILTKLLIFKAQQTYRKN